VWVLPFLILGAVLLAVSRSPRESAPPQRQLAPGSPGPISVLGEFVRVGRVPPPPVILCAIAEAEAIGRCDLASDIVRVFVAPVVYQHELANARHVRPTYERGSCASPRSPRDVINVRPAVPTLTQRHASDEEIRAMLDADPEGFIKMASRGAPMIDVPNEAVLQATAQETVTMPSMDASPMQPAQPAPTPQAQPIGLPPEVVAQMQEAAGLHEAADHARAIAAGSPIASVPDDAWREFVMHLERESPMFNSSRHVGQYRQRKERLLELGIEPDTLHGSREAQRHALDVDLTDAHYHADASGLAEQHVRRLIRVPGHDEPVTITLSGVLGVIQAAGIDGAVGWLEDQKDRRRYPHTTQAFLNTNGVF
jgi:hypothetical protein